MLGNLMAEVEAEQAADDSTAGQLKTWCGTEVSGAEKRLETLRTTLESLAANLAGLRAQRQELASRVEDLSDQVETMKTQLADAQEKRSKEEAAFVAEQQDFEQSITACTKAVEILKQHYGDGAPPANTRPAWMSLLAVQQSVERRSVAVSPDLAALLQQAQAQNGGGFFGYAGTVRATGGEAVGNAAAVGGGFNLLEMTEAVLTEMELANAEEAIKEMDGYKLQGVAINVVEAQRSREARQLRGPEAARTSTHCAE